MKPVRVVLSLLTLVVLGTGCRIDSEHRAESAVSPPVAPADAGAASGTTRSLAAPLGGATEADVEPPLEILPDLG